MFLVNLLDFSLKFSLFFGFAQIIRIFLRVFGPFNLLLSVPSLVSLGEEVPLPGLLPPDTIVHKAVKRDHNRDNGPSGSSGHVREIVIMLECLPFLKESLIISVSLRLGLASDELGDEEASNTSFDSEISFSSSGLDEPVIRMQALTGHVLEQDTSPQLIIPMQKLILESETSLQEEITLPAPFIIMPDCEERQQ